MSLVSNKIRYLEFRPYLENIDVAPQFPKDLGYYYKILSNDGRLIKNTLEDNGFVENNKDQWIIFWSSAPIKNNIYLNLKEYQKVNHFPRSVEITRKDLLYKNIARMETMFQRNFSFVPLSFLLPNELTYLQDALEKDNMILIVKPVASSQGRGIFITNNLQEVKII